MLQNVPDIILYKQKAIDIRVYLTRIKLWVHHKVKYYKLQYSCVTLLLAIETFNKTPRAMYLKKLQLTFRLVNYIAVVQNVAFKSPFLLVLKYV